jgi:hypothetical protein
MADSSLGEAQQQLHVYTDKQRKVLDALEVEARKLFPPSTTVFYNISILKSKVQGWAKKHGPGTSHQGHALPCQLATQPNSWKKKNAQNRIKNNIGVEQQRQSTSKRCGCKFVIRFASATSKNMKAGVLKGSVRITQGSYYRHTNGCFPSKCVDKNGCLPSKCVDKNSSGSQKQPPQSPKQHKQVMFPRFGMRTPTAKSALVATPARTPQERYFDLTESHHKQREKRDDKDILFLNVITDLGQDETSAINKTYEAKALALKEAYVDIKGMVRSLLKDRKTRSDAADADNEAMRGMLATFTPTRKTQGDRRRRRLVFDDTEEEEVVQEEGDEEVFQDVDEDLDEIADVEEEEEEEEEEQVEEEDEDEEEEEEYETLMASTNDKDLKARVTVDVIMRMQHNNLINVFIKFVDFGGQWPKKKVLAAFLAKFDVRPPPTGATRADLVVLVVDVLGKNS